VPSIDSSARPQVVYGARTGKVPAPKRGGSGAGSSMPIALDRAAIREGYSVLFVTAPALVAALAKAHGEGRLEERLGFYAKPKLLIVDELGYLPFEPNAAHHFFQLAAGGRGWRWRPRSRRTRCPIRRP
jgi:hypothetical protein